MKVIVNTFLAFISDLTKFLKIIHKVKAIISNINKQIPIIIKIHPNVSKKGTILGSNPYINEKLKKNIPIKILINQVVE